MTSLEDKFVQSVTGGWPPARFGRTDTFMLKMCKHIEEDTIGYEEPMGMSKKKRGKGKSRHTKANRWR